MLKMSKKQTMVNKIIRDCTAAVSVEASFIFILLAAIIVGVADTSKALIAKERLDRMSYSFVSIVRERDLFNAAKFLEEDREKDGEEVIKAEEEKDKKKESMIDSLYIYASTYANDFLRDVKDIGMVIEMMSFDIKEIERQKVKEIKQVSRGKKCDVNIFSDYTDLSVKVNGKYVNLYRVTFCIDQKSNFVNINNVTSGILKLASSSIAPER